MEEFFEKWFFLFFQLLLHDRIPKNFYDGKLCELFFRAVVLVSIDKVEPPEGYFINVVALLAILEELCHLFLFHHLENGLYLQAHWIVYILFGLHEYCFNPFKKRLYFVLEVKSLIIFIVLNSFSILFEIGVVESLIHCLVADLFISSHMHSKVKIYQLKKMLIIL